MTYADEPTTFFTGRVKFDCPYCDLYLKDDTDTSASQALMDRAAKEHLEKKHPEKAILAREITDFLRARVDEDNVVANTHAHIGGLRALEEGQAHWRRLIRSVMAKQRLLRLHEDAHVCEPPPAKNLSASYRNAQY